MIPSKITDRYLKRAVVAAIGVTVREVGNELVVSGPYSAMEKIYPKLKTRGFTYNSSDKSWRMPLSVYNSLTSVKRKNLDAILHGLGPSPAEIKQVQDIQDLAKRLVTEKFVGITVHIHGDTLSVSGTTYPIKEDLKDAGGRWDGSRAFDFDLQRISLEKLEQLQTTLKKRSEFNEGRIQKIQALFPDRVRKWPTINITLGHTDHDGWTIRGDTRSFASNIKALFSHPVWTGSNWSLKALDEASDNFRKAIEFFDGAEAKAIAQREEAYAKLDKDQADPKREEEKAPPKAPSCRPNQKPGPCDRCGDMVDVGDGCIYQTLDEDDDRLIWKVHHKNPAVCEANKRQRQEERQRIREVHLSRETARRKVYDWAIAHNVTPPGVSDPDGREVPMRGTSSRIYGGGEWVLIERDEKHFWYVTNNGADGDDWAHNNFRTGGAGAIGVRAPLTPEVLSWIEDAKER